MDKKSYLKLHDWTLIEAACLLSDIKPIPEHEFEISLETGGKPAFFYRQLKGATSNGEIVYFQVDPLLKRRRVAPHDAVTWARKHGYEIPKFLAGLGAPSSEEHEKTPNTQQPLQRQRHQEQEILRVIAELGYKPSALPKRVPGKPWVKSEVRNKLKFSASAFNKAWERLRTDGELAEAS